MSKSTAGAKKTPEAGRTDSRTVPEQPWDADWQNEKGRREEGVDQISPWLLKKRKSRHLARERDIGRQRAANLLKHGDAEVPDEEVL